MSIRAHAASPSGMELDPPYEPPGGGPIQIRYRIARSGRPVRLAIYDVRGREMWALRKGPSGPGEHGTIWGRLDRAGAPASRGVYFVRLETGGETASRKLVLLHR